MTLPTTVEIEMPQDVVFVISTPYGKVRIDTCHEMQYSTIETFDDSVTVEIDNAGLHVIGYQAVNP